MAVYATTTTLDTPRATRIGNSPMGVLSGSVNLTNYNSAKVAVTAITGQFRGGSNLRVIPEAVSSNGQLVAWDEASSAFKCYVTTTGAEVANDVNVGTFGFHA